MKNRKLGRAREISSGKVRAAFEKMSGKTERRTYQKFLSRFFWMTLLALAIAVGGILTLRYTFKGKAADIIVALIDAVSGSGIKSSREFYWNVINENINIIIWGLIIIVFVALLRGFMRLFIKYLDQLADGIEELSLEKAEPISLIPQLEEMEVALNAVREELIVNREKILQEEKEKSDFILYLAHDIKTPLTSVIGYLALIKEQPNMSVSQKDKYANIALNKAYRLENLINEFFEVARYTYEAARLNKNKISLAFLLMQIEDEMYPQINATGKSLNIDVSDEVTIDVDADKIARAINNVLKNAISYGKDRCTIYVSASETPEAVWLFIRHQANVPKDKVQSIFDKFYRLDEARSSETGGAGLGLAIARDILQLHGGYITADTNQTEDEIKFTLCIPKSD